MSLQTFQAQSATRSSTIDSNKSIPGDTDFTEGEGEVLPPNCDINKHFIWQRPKNW